MNESHTTAVGTRGKTRWALMRVRPMCEGVPDETIASGVLDSGGITDEAHVAARFARDNPGYFWGVS